MIGNKTSLYKYSQSTSSGVSNVSANQVFYTFEKEGGEFLFLPNMLNKKFKSQLKEFYKDYPEAQLIIDNKLKYWLELEDDQKEVLAAVNES